MVKKYRNCWRYENLPTPKILEKACQGLDVSPHDVFVQIIRSRFKNTKREIVWRRKRSS